MRHRSYRQCGPVRRTQREQPLAPSSQMVRAVLVPMVLGGGAVTHASTFNLTTHAPSHYIRVRHRHEAFLTEHLLVPRLHEGLG